MLLTKALKIIQIPKFQFNIGYKSTQIVIIMLPSTAGAQQYVLTLDSLDSNFVCQYAQKTSDAVKPLWSKSKMDGESTFCHVELVAENLKDNAMPLVENCICYICHVCVPRSYYKKHMKSERHKLYSKLTEKVLENVARQIEVNSNYVSKDEHLKKNNEYYCESCSKLISVGEKLKHNLSRTHLSSVENINMTKKFFKMYVSHSSTTSAWDKKMRELLVKVFRPLGVNVFDNAETDNSISTTSLTSTVYGFEEDESDIDFEEICIEPSASEDFLKAPSSPDVLLETGKQLKLSFESYLKENKEYEYYFKMPIIEMNSVLVETPIGYKEHIPFDSFHSYMRKTIVIYCQVCDEWLDNKYEKVHSASKEHIHNIMKPVNDSFQREIVNRRSQHCLLCNALTLKHHEFCSPNHEKYNQQRNQEILKNTHKTFCATCMVHIDTHNFIGHTKGNRHQQKLKKKLASNNTPNAVNSEYEGILKQITPKAPIDRTNVTVNESIIRKLINFTATQKKKTYCPTCDVYIDTHNFIAHTKSSKHKKKIEIGQEFNKSNIVRNNYKAVFCKICQVPVPKDGMDTHVRGKPHRDKSRTSVISVGKVSVQPSTSKPVQGKQTRSQRRKMRELLREEFGDSDK